MKSCAHTVYLFLCLELLVNSFFYKTVSNKGHITAVLYIVGLNKQLKFVL